FKESIYELYKLPEPHLLGRKFGKDPELLLNAVVEIGELIESIKTNFFEKGFRNIYNKLKHPFLVVSPENYPKNEKYVLPVMTKPEDSADLSTAYPVDGHHWITLLGQSRAYVAYIEVFAPHVVKRPADEQ
ncbi:MAG: hypothetical protein ACE5K8_06575, partial [Candidatus Zixiibacteriota bacterium]